MPDAVTDEPELLAHWQTEVVALIPFAIAVDGDIGREHERGIAGLVLAADHLLRELALNDIELEPDVAQDAAATSSIKAFEAVDSTEGIPCFSAARASGMSPLGQSSALRPVGPIMNGAA
jgi:hypothetical protein